MAGLAEDLFLLGCDAATGSPLIDLTHLELGLGGALLLDLVMRGRVVLGDARVTVIDPEPTGDRLLDPALSALGAARPHEVGHWVRHLAGKARHAVQEHLVETGVLRRDERKVLGIFPVHRTHEADGRLHHELVDHLHDAVVLDHDPSRETAVLASLALAVGLEPHLFPRADRTAVRHRMAEIAGGYPEAEPVVDAVRRAVNAADAARGITPGQESSRERQDPG